MKNYNPNTFNQYLSAHGFAEAHNKEIFPHPEDNKKGVKLEDACCIPNGHFYVKKTKEKIYILEAHGHNITKLKLYQTTQTELIQGVIFNPLNLENLEVMNLGKDTYNFLKDKKPLTERLM